MVGIGNTTLQDSGRLLIILQTGIVWKVSTYTFTDGWHHVVTTRDASNNFIVYVDGVSVYTVNFAPVAGATGLVLGGQSSTTSSRNLPTTARLDNVAFYNTVLSPARVLAHYKAGYELLTAPAIVTGLTATGGDTTASLAWTAQIGVLTWEYRLNGGTPVTVTSPQATASGLTNGTTYAVEVRATTTAGGPGPWSTAVNVTPTPVSIDDFSTDPIAGNRVTVSQGGTWTWENNRLHQQDSSLVSKFLFMSAMPRLSSVDYEFDYCMSYDPAARLHCGAFLQAADGTTVTGFRITHLDAAYIIEAFTNNVGAGGITPTATGAAVHPIAGRWMRWRVRHDFATGQGSLYVDGVMAITWTNASFGTSATGRPGFHSYGAQYDIDNVVSGRVNFAPLLAPANVQVQAAPTGFGYSFNAAHEATGYEYRLDGGAAVALTNYHGRVSGLVDGTTYAVQFRTVNSFGNGPWSTAVNVTPTTTPYEALVMTKSPVIFTRLDETTLSDWLLDLGSNAKDWRINHPSKLGQPALTVEPGRKAALTPGSTRYPASLATLPNIPTALTTAPETVECWVKVPPGNLQGYFMNSGNSGGWAFGIGSAGAGGNMDAVGRQLMVLQEQIAWKVTGYNFPDDGVSSPTYHIAVTRATGDIWNVYVNGVLVNTQTWTPQAYNTIAHMLSIGGPSRDATSQRSPNGVGLDQCVYYSTSHTIEEINSRYNAGAELQTAPGAVTGLTAQALNNSALITWNNYIGVFQFEYRVNGGSVLPASVVRKQTVTGLTNGTPATIEVRAKTTNGGVGPWTAVVVTPVVPYLLDDFERADSATLPGTPTVGGPYTVQSGTFGITNGRLYNPGGNVDNLLTFPAGSDIEISARFGTIVDNSGLVWRGKDANNYWLCNQSGANLIGIWRKQAGTFSNLFAYTALTFTPYDLIRVVALGRRFYIYYQGNLIHSMEDTAYDVTATLAGVRMALNTNNRYDDLYAAPPAPLPTLAGVLNPYTGLAVTRPGTFVYKGRDTKTLDSGSVA